jgi:glycosyltransferase involved in cell wall biosynthesis
MGLSNAHSGIGQVAQHLYSRLKNTTYRPTVIGNDLATDFGQPLALGPVSNRFAKYKNLNADICYSAALHDAAGRKAILHGFANINVPTVLRKIDSFKYFLTIHDVIPLTDPDKVSKSQAAQFRLGFFRAVAKADRIITVSNWTKQAVAFAAPTAASKIIVIRNGRPNQREDRTQNIRNTNCEYAAVFVGRFEIYKRFELLAKIINLAPSTWKFCIVTDAVGKAKIESLCGAKLKSDRLLVVNGISDREIAEIYSKTKCMISTSLLEGFGLPAAEALSYSVPVVWTTGSAIDEFCNDSVGQGIAPSEPASTWIEAIAGFQNLKPEAINFRHILEQMPTWDDAAKELSLLYAE